MPIKLLNFELTDTLAFMSDLVYKNETEKGTVADIDFKSRSFVVFGSHPEYIHHIGRSIQLIGKPSWNNYNTEELKSKTGFVLDRENNFEIRGPAYEDNKHIGTLCYFRDGRLKVVNDPTINDISLKTSGENITNEVSVYTKEQKEIINKWPYFRKLDDSHLHRGDIFLNERKINANELIVEGLNKHKGWKCWAGLDMIYIEWGKIFRAECMQGGLIGTLEDYILPQKTVICNKKLCGCLSDIYLRKELVQ